MTAQAEKGGGFDSLEDDCKATMVLKDKLKGLSEELARSVGLD